MTSWLSAIEVPRRSPRRPRAGHNHPVAMATIEAALSGDGVGVGVPRDVDERELVDGHSITLYPTPYRRSGCSAGGICLGDVEFCSCRRGRRPQGRTAPADLPPPEESGSVSYEPLANLHGLTSLSGAGGSTRRRHSNTLYPTPRQLAGAPLTWNAPVVLLSAGSSAPRPHGPRRPPLPRRVGVGVGQLRAPS